jgi:hypothetical protein
MSTSILMYFQAMSGAGLIAVSDACHNPLKIQRFILINFPEKQQDKSGKERKLLIPSLAKRGI